MLRVTSARHPARARGRVWAHRNVAAARRAAVARRRLDKYVNTRQLKTKLLKKNMHWWLDSEEIQDFKRCCECYELHPLENFTRQKEARDNHASRCKTCTISCGKLLRRLRQLYPPPPPNTPCCYCDRVVEKHHLDHDHDLPFPQCFRGYSCSSCNQRYRRFN